MDKFVIFSIHAPMPGPGKGNPQSDPASLFRTVAGYRFYGYR